MLIVLQQYTATIHGHMHINSNENYLAVGPIGILNKYIVFNREYDSEKTYSYIDVCTESFYGTLDRYKTYIKKKYGTNKHTLYPYKKIISMAEKILGRPDPIRSLIIKEEKEASPDHMVNVGPLGLIYKKGGKTYLNVTGVPAKKINLLALEIAATLLCVKPE